MNILRIFVILVMAFPAMRSAHAQEPAPIPWRDDFDGTLNDGWYWLNVNPDKWSLTENAGFLRIYTSPYATGGENLLLRPVAPGDFMIKTRVLFEPDTNFQFAGLVVWQDEHNFLQLGRAVCDVEGACIGNGLYFDKVVGGDWADGNFGTSIDNPSDVFLRLERRGDMVRTYYSADEGISWYEIGIHWIPPDFQVNAVGLTASQDYNTPDWDPPADFDFFEMTEGWGFLPEGFHDYDQGDVPPWACNAGGWTADPDDRAADVNVEIVVDHQTVTTLPAGEFRQDLLDAGVCEDGNCSFSTSLWGAISSYEPHRVDVWAQDTWMGDWVLLSNSAKALTCRTYDIYTFDPATGTTKQITNLPDTHEYNPRWSPDGKMVVHDTWNTDWSSHGVYITDVKLGVSSPLAGAVGGSYPTWSPSGKWIAFDRGADEDYRLFIVPPTGGDPQLVAEDAFMASWPPNSQRLAFHRPSDGSIRTVELMTGTETTVVESGNAPAWSPDGQWIAFELDGDIWKVRVNNNGIRFGDPIQLTSSPVFEGRPAWSNNSRTIAFHAGMGEDFDIWTVPASGGTATWMTGAPVFGDYDPNYSFSGQYIGYSGFSPEGQAARQWIAVFKSDLPPGAWTAGEHSYYFGDNWGHQGEPVPLTVSDEALLYGGYALLRGAALWANDGNQCFNISTIHPNQATRFHSGWPTDEPTTYQQAKSYFSGLAPWVVWDGGEAVDLPFYEIRPYSPDTWQEYFCAFTEPPPMIDLRVMYGDDWVESFYEAGHTVSIQVTDGQGNVKATAEVYTAPREEWGGAEGFQTRPEDWNPVLPDIQPNDWVYAQVDNGAMAQVQIGEISGIIDLSTDSIQGTVLAPWFSNEVEVECHSWGAPLPYEIMKYDSAQPDGMDIYSCAWDPGSEWDIQAGQNVGVGYFGLDGHWVANYFFVPSPE